jgi:hypothetical protein
VSPQSRTSKPPETRCRPGRCSCVGLEAAATSQTQLGIRSCPFRDRDGHAVRTIRGGCFLRMVGAGMLAIAPGGPSTRPLGHRSAHQTHRPALGRRRPLLAVTRARFKWRSPAICIRSAAPKPTACQATATPPWTHPRSSCRRSRSRAKRSPIVPDARHQLVANAIARVNAVP